MNSGAAKEERQSVWITISCFLVANNVPCICGKYYKKIFQIFQRLRPRDAVESMGVRLTMVNKIVEVRRSDYEEMDNHGNDM